MKRLEEFLIEHFDYRYVRFNYSIFLSSKDLSISKDCFSDDNTCYVYIVCEQFFINLGYKKDDSYVYKDDNVIFISNSSLSFANKLSQENIRHQEISFSSSFTKNIIKEIIRELLIVCKLCDKEDADEIIKEFLIKMELKIISELANSLIVGLREDKMKEINQLQYLIHYSRSEMMRFSSKLEKALQVDAFSIGITKDNFIKEIRNIMEHKKVEDVTVNGNNLVIETVPLILTEPLTNLEFKLGNITIKINLLTGKVSFSSEVLAQSIWGMSPHPHVDNTGVPCLGTAEGQVADMLINKHFYGVFITLLNYLETCDVHDSAGGKIFEWECLTENKHEVIEILSEYCEYDEEEETEECNECRRIDNVDNMYFCVGCEEWYCEMHASYREDAGETLCDVCYGDWLENNPEEEGDR